MIKRKTDDHIDHGSFNSCVDMQVSRILYSLWYIRDIPDSLISYDNHRVTRWPSITLVRLFSLLLVPVNMAICNGASKIRISVRILPICRTDGDVETGAVEQRSRFPLANENRATGCIKFDTRGMTEKNDKSCGWQFSRSGTLTKPIPPVPPLYIRSIQNAGLHCPVRCLPR